MRLTRWVGFAALVAMAACRGDAKRDAATAAVDSTVVEKKDSLTTPAPAPSAYGISGDTTGLGFKVIAEFTQDSLTMSTTEIPAGEVTIIAQNKSTDTHRLEIIGAAGGRWRTLKVPPGGTVTLNSTMMPGDYDAHDPDVKNKGYKTKLVVK